ncbi:type 1 glutamine amidotransferase domain-containing protein [Geodermatophilus nigrescens]|uniref:Protease I n=1 Tax=Geodermatophilus nigrescens TaxID=1070870 RepID=A0A1M5F0K0_9ACTN|nr:type 1 glutamine amidotransferase domain-containing protein [Geodermatophilus nigrescens]SHF85055.1 protease I [Geodermatophilus nigrescens]
MPIRRRLEGRTIAALAADGFEKVELVVPLRTLQAAGAEVHVVSLRRGRIRGVNLHVPASRVRVDRTVEQADPGDYDGLLLPGGFINPDLLRQSAAAREFVRAFAASGKPIATLCHGPWVLASAGLLDGRTLTSWPGIRDDLVYAGATWLDQDLVRDGNLTTSRGPQDMAAFVRGMLDAFAATAPEPARAAPRRASDPQPEAPVGWAVGALRWSPKPSAAALMGVGLAAAVQRTLNGPDARTRRSRAAGRTGGRPRPRWLPAAP